MSCISLHSDMVYITMFYFIEVIIELDDATILLCLLHNTRCIAWNFQSVATYMKNYIIHLNRRQVFFLGERSLLIQKDPHR